jgi:glycolate oxidase FAD binding subunit
VSDVAAQADSLRAMLGDDYLLSGAEDCADYSVDGIVPGMVAFPRTPEEVCAVVAHCAAKGKAIIARGAGQRIGIGNVPQRVDVVLSTARMNHVVEYDPQNLVVTARAGRNLASLQSQLRQDGLFLPLNLPADSHDTVGGIIAANVSGPKRLRYGSARDVVLGLGVVAPSGEYLQFGGRVVKNVSGYDMSKLYIGSYGALGVITEVTFRLLPLPAREVTLLAGFDGLAAPLRVIARIMDSVLEPASLTLLNREAAQALAQAPLGSLTERPYVLAVALEGSRQAAERQLQEMVRLCQDEGALESGYLDSRPQGQLWSAVRDFPVHGAEGQVVCRAMVPPAEVGNMVEVALKECGAAGVSPLVVAQGGVGSVLVAFAQGESDVRAASIVKAVMDSATRLGGHCLLVQAPVAVKRQVHVWGAPRAEWELMARLKRAFDPTGILSPGRFVGGI